MSKIWYNRFIVTIKMFPNEGYALWAIAYLLETIASLYAESLGKELE